MEIRNMESESFLVEIKFVRNGTWQGEVKSLESGEPVRFRSALEMLKIMDGALMSEEAADEERRFSAEG